MERVTWQNVVFQSKGMMPEEGDEFTTTWARRLVSNLYAAYGIIGTIYFTNQPIEWINLGLTRKFKFPPSVFIYHRGTSGLTLDLDDNPAYRTVQTFINGDFLGVQAITGTASPIPIYYRLHGV